MTSLNKTKGKEENREEFVQTRVQRIKNAKPQRKALSVGKNYGSEEGDGMRNGRQLWFDEGERNWKT